jgi:hypothetical protein
MAVTAGGTPYVESSDLVANYPATSLSLANKVDTKSDITSPTFLAGINLNASTAYAPQMILTQTSNDATSPYIIVQKSRNGLINNNNDGVVTMALRGHDGVGYQNVAAITSAIDGAPSAGDLPGRLSFFTTPAGSTTINERLRISSNGSITGSGSLGAWTAFTPTFTAQFTLGNGTVSAYYCQIGKIVHYRGAIVYGSTTAYGNVATDTVQFNLPLAARTPLSSVLGVGSYVDVSLGRGYPVEIGPNTSTQISLTFGVTNVTANTVTNSTFNNNFPVAEGTGDTLSWSLTYEKE